MEGVRRGRQSNECTYVDQGSVLLSVPQVREGVSSYMSSKKRRRRVRDYQPLSTTEKM